jgi:hypothetical protein
MKPKTTDLFREWQTNPETVKICTEAKRERDGVLLRRLREACRSSNDGNVRAALQKYESCEEFIAFLEGKPGEGDI